MSLGVQYTTTSNAASGDVESAGCHRHNDHCGHHDKHKKFSCSHFCDWDWWGKHKWLWIIGAVLLGALIVCLLALLVVTLFHFKFAAEAAYIFDQTNQTVLAGDSVIFSDNAYITDKIVHAPDSSEIIFLEKGVYSIQFYVNPEGSDVIGFADGWQFSLFLDGLPLLDPAARYGSGSTTGLIAPVGPGTTPLSAITSNQVIAFIPKFGVLSLRNDGSTTDPVELSNNAGGANIVVSASISIHQIRNW